MKYKYIIPLLLAFWLTVTSFCHAQDIYEKGNDGDYVVTLSTGTIPGYDLKVPNTTNGGFIQSVALYVTSNNSECDASLSSRWSLDYNVHHPKLKPGNDPDEQPLPVIVFGYGGGFLSPLSTAKAGIPEWLASKGFIVITPAYRIGIDLYNKDLATRAIWRAVQDIRIINRFARQAKAKDKYAVDQDKPLTYVGWSSGGFIGLHNLYLDEGNRPDPTEPGYIVRANNWILPNSSIKTYDLGKLDQTHILSNYTGDPIPNITVSISGAVGNLAYIRTSQDKKPRALCTIHHPDDGVVPYKIGPAYKNFSLFASSSYDYPEVSGSGAIKNYFDHASINKPKIYEHYIMKKGGVGMDIIDGDAGGYRGPLFKATWYHDPAEDGKHLAVMDTILKFIKGATQKFSSNGLAVKKQELPNLSSSQNKNNIIYPNPTKGQFSVYLGNKDVDKVDIYNIMGELVYSKKILDTDFSISIDLRSKGNGIYIIHLYTLNGIEKRKLIVD